MRPPTGPPARWATSALSVDAHALVPDAEQPAGALRMLCGAELEATATWYNQPPGPRLCPSCWVIFSGTAGADSRLRGQGRGRGPGAADLYESQATLSPS